MGNCARDSVLSRQWKRSNGLAKNRFTGTAEMRLDNAILATAVI